MEGSNYKGVFYVSLETLLRKTSNKPLIIVGDFGDNRVTPKYLREMKVMHYAFG